MIKINSLFTQPYFKEEDEKSFEQACNQSAAIAFSKVGGLADPKQIEERIYQEFIKALILKIKK